MINLKKNKILILGATGTLGHTLLHNLSTYKENLVYGTVRNKKEFYKDDKKIIIAKMEEMRNKKENAQPSRIKTSGSTFKNPVGKSNKKVWELIRDSVALDKNFGDAYISEKHCNFFVNKGNATFEDMNNLINYVTEKVFDKTGIKIEKEIKILK